jgi:hypothetical protein
MGAEAPARTGLNLLDLTMPIAGLIRTQLIAPKAHQERHIVFWLHRTAPRRRSLERGYQRSVDKTSTEVQREEEKGVKTKSKRGEGLSGEAEKRRLGDEETSDTVCFLVSLSPCLDAIAVRKCLGFGNGLFGIQEPAGFPAGA